MNILYTLNSGHPGGMEQHVLDLVEGMVQEGHEVYVWCRSGAIVDWYGDAGALVTVADIKTDLDPFYIFKLARFLKQKKIDVLHAHELKAVGNSLIAGFLAGTSVRISHTHTPLSEWQVPNVQKRLNILFNSFVVNTFSTKEIALTESRKRVKIEEGIKEEKLATIPNALRFEDFSLTSAERLEYKDEIVSRYDIPKGSYIFGNVSRVSKEKGHEVLISGYARFCKLLEARREENNSFLFIGGGGPLEQDLREKVSSIGLEDHVVITGRFSKEDHKKFYAAFDSFVFPSLAEGFGIVLIEAMAFCLPVICSDLEVLQEVGGSTVRYFETGSSEDLSEKLYDLYTRKDQYYDFGEKACARVEELYTMERFVKKYLDLYRELLA
ncbi:glycosyltransferase [candidate division WWE3 bacterium]|nr:glycosyltransferase [candidate division WWE3 bacterium]